MECNDTQRMDTALDEARENVREALVKYGRVLGAAEVLADTGSYRNRQVRASHVQVEAAKRVLWMDS